MKIKYESNHFPAHSNPDLCRRFEIEFDLYSTSDVDCMAENVSVWDIEAGDIEVPLESFPPEEQAEIEARLQAIADENAHENWFEQQIARAEAWADSMEDR